MSLIDIIICMGIAVLGAIILKSVIKSRKQGCRSCGHNCACCSSCSADHFRRVIEDGKNNM